MILINVLLDKKKKHSHLPSQQQQIQQTRLKAKPFHFPFHDETCLNSSGSVNTTTEW